MANDSFVLVSAVKDEAGYIEATIRSVLAQTRPPAEWVIVSDGSTDGTDEIVSSFARTAPFIRLLRLDSPRDRDFGSKVRAFNTGVASLTVTDFAFIGCLDGDITLVPRYYETLLERFARMPRLGLCAGWIHEERDGVMSPRPFNSRHSAPHSIHFSRRSLFESVGGYLPLRFGGEDWCYEVMARSQGWDILSFPDLPVYHHRHSSSARGIVRGRFNQGRMDGQLRSLLLFELLFCARRLFEAPPVAGSAIRFLGYLWERALARESLVPPEVRAFSRSLQKRRIAAQLRRMLGGAGDGPPRGKGAGR